MSRNRDRDKDKDRDRGRHHDRNRDGKLNDEARDRNRNRPHQATRVYNSYNYGNYQYSSNAYDRGYEEGLRTGASDGRRGQPYDPERSHFYRSGSSGFSSIFGTRGSYQFAYRDGFLRGYEEGYQNWERYYFGGYFHR